MTAACSAAKVLGTQTGPYVQQGMLVLQQQKPSALLVVGSVGLNLLNEKVTTDAQTNFSVQVAPMLRKL